MANEFMDLGAKPMEATIAPKPSDAKKKYYPSVYVSNCDKLDVEQGDEVLIKGKVTSCTMTNRNGVETCSCEIECTGLQVTDDVDEPNGEGLDGALDKISKKKMEDNNEE